MSTLMSEEVAECQTLFAKGLSKWEAMMQARHTTFLKLDRATEAERKVLLAAADAEAELAGIKPISEQYRWWIENDRQMTPSGETGVVVRYITTMDND